MKFGVLGGLSIGTVGAVLWRKANLVTDNLGINVLGYFTPALALCWLFAFSQVGDVDFLSLGLGVLTIISANVGMYVLTREQPQESAESIDIGALIASGETGSDKVEVKSTLRMDLNVPSNNKTGRRNRGSDDIRLASLKTIAGFLNAHGGTLIIGVDDNGDPVDPDGVVVKDEFENEDKMLLHLTAIVKNRMGSVTMLRVHPKFHDHPDGSRILVVICDPGGTQPTLVQNGNDQDYYVRNANSTEKLSMEDALRHRQERFPD